MLREQMINFLEAAVVFLLATNAASVLAALYAMRLANADILPFDFAELVFGVAFRPRFHA